MMALYPKPFYVWTTYAGHGGVDYPYPAYTPIPAVHEGVITFSGWWNDRAGWTRTLTTPEGIQIMHCHLVNLDGPPVGSRVSKGQTIAYVGTTGHSTGNHLHQEIWINGVKQVGDAYWRIIDKYSVVTPTGSGAGSGGGSTPSKPNPAPTPTPITEDEDMKVIVTNGNYYAIAKQFLSHLGSSAQVTEAEAMYGKARNLGNGNAASTAGTKLRAQLDLHGVPQGVLDGDGRVLNPQSGKFEANGTWSREREILARK